MEELVSARSRVGEEVARDEAQMSPCCWLWEPRWYRPSAPSIRQRSAHEIVDKQVGAWELFRLSVRDTRWWLGAVAAVANYALQAAALSIGSVMLVTALQVTVLLFALPINARITHHRVTAWEWFWAASLAAAVAIILMVGNPTSDQQRASWKPGRWCSW